MSRRPARWRLALAGLGLASLAALAPVQSHAASTPLLERVALPEGARLHLIGHDILQNGRRLSIARFATAASVAQTLDWYRQRWPERDGVPGHVIAEAGPWRIVSRLHEGSNIALQLEPTAEGGAAGFLSVMPLEGDARPVDAGAMPPGATSLSDTQAMDPAGRARTRLLRAPGTPAQAAAFYRDHLVRDGWTLQNRQSGGSAAVLLFSSSRGRLEVVAAPHGEGGTFIVLNSVTGGQRDAHAAAKR